MTNTRKQVKPPQYMYSSMSGFVRTNAGSDLDIVQTNFHVERIAEASNLFMAILDFKWLINLAFAYPRYRYICTSHRVHKICV